MKAILDCNNFYCACERLFLPHLAEKPVIVLSNNDGCIVSRSDEAKLLGIPMAGPYFMAKPVIEKNKVVVFSSNYNLYGDLSWRVMETLRQAVGKENVEVYSVDEAFLNLSLYAHTNLYATGLQLKDEVEQWTGIKVSVGIAPTKVLCKVANHIAKKNKIATNCVVVLTDAAEIKKALQQTPVNEIWGIGSRYAQKLKEHWSIYDAWQLCNMSESFAAKELGGVVGKRLIRELRGESVREMQEELLVKKMIATTRMFGQPAKTLQEIKEAVATYTSRAAEKLRRQHSAAKHISVFVVAKSQKNNADFRGEMYSLSATLPIPTAFTNELIKYAVALAEKLYTKGFIYKKAGVMLSGLVPDSSIQANLFYPSAKHNERKLMEMIDNVNFSQGSDILKFAASGTKRNWKMRQELRSPRYTTRWNELFTLT
jgi:DNA polymerase V